jgi:hypothetical protein
MALFKPLWLQIFSKDTVGATKAGVSNARLMATV